MNEFELLIQRISRMRGVCTVWTKFCEQLKPPVSSNRNVYVEF